MTSTDLRAEQLMQKLRRALPLTAHGRPSLTAVLGRSRSCVDVMPRVTVTDVFYAGEEKGLMCRLDVQGFADDPVIVVAPVTQLTFNRRHPVARDIAAYRKRRAKAAAVNILRGR
jgi:hypothetical protein